MCFLAEQLGQDLQTIKQMPDGDYHALLGYFELKNDNEKKASDDAKNKSRSSGSRGKTSMGRGR